MLQSYKLARIVFAGALTWLGAGNAFAQTDATVVAEVNGVKLTIADFVRPNHVVQLGYPPLRIDLLTSIAGVEFRSCYENRILVDMGGVTVSFIGIDDLRKNKAASGRPEDLADLHKLR